MVPPEEELAVQVARLDRVHVDLRARRAARQSRHLTRPGKRGVRYRSRARTISMSSKPLSTSVFSSSQPMPPAPTISTAAERQQREVSSRLAKAAQGAAMRRIARGAQLRTFRVLEELLIGAHRGDAAPWRARKRAVRRRARLTRSRAPHCVARHLRSTGASCSCLRRSAARAAAARQKTSAQPPGRNSHGVLVPAYSQLRRC